MKRAILTLFAAALCALLVVLWWPTDSGSQFAAGPDSGVIDSLAPPPTPVEVVHTGSFGELPDRIDLPVDANAPAARLRVVVRAADGNPVPDLEVRVEPRLVVDGWTDERGATTDRDGAAVFELAPGAWRCSTALGGTAEVVLRAEEQRILTIDLAAAPWLDGAVVDGDGRGIAGATVVLARTQIDGSLGRSRSVAHTDRDGRFHLVAVEINAWVSATHPDWGPSAPQPLQMRGGGWDPVTIVLRRDAGRVRGVVLRPDGGPAADAVVLAGSENQRPHADRPDQAFGPPLQRVAVAADGSFLTPLLLPGPVTVLAQAPGFAVARASATVRAGIEVEVRIVLDAGAAVSGIVVDADGAPAGGAFVFSGARRAFGSRMEVTADDGTFALRGLPAGAVELTAFRRRSDGTSESAAEVLLLANGTETRWEPTLEAASDRWLRGRVEDHRGAPLTGWHVLAKPVGERRGLGTDSGVDGDFELRGLKPDVDLVLTVHPPWAGFTGFPTVVLAPLRAGGDPVVLRVPDLAVETAALTGRVLDADGRGAAATLTMTRDECGTLASYATDADGRFRIAAIPPGTIRVTVRRDEHPQLRLPPLRLVPHEVRDLGALQLTRGGRIGGRLLGPNGEVATGVSIRVVDADEHDAGTCECSEFDYRTPLLPAGRYTLLVQATGLAAQRVGVTIARGEDRTLDLQLRPGSPHRIRVHTADPRDRSAMVSILLRDGDGKPLWESHLPMSDGTAQFHTWLLPGSYSVLALGVRNHRALASFAVPTAELALAEPDRTLTVVELQPPEPR